MLHSKMEQAEEEALEILISQIHSQISLKIFLVTLVEAEEEEIEKLILEVRT